MVVVDGPFCAFYYINFAFPVSTTKSIERNAIRWSSFMGGPLPL